MTTPEDPIERLVLDIQAIRQTLDEIAKRGIATSGEVLEAMQIAREAPIDFKPILNAKAVAEHITPKLLEGLPTNISIEQHIAAINKAGQEAAEKIHHARRLIPSYIGFSDTIFGFTNWKAFLLMTAVGLLFATGMGYWVHYERERAVYYSTAYAKSEEDKKTLANFVEWTMKTYPKAYDKWKKSR